MCYDGLLAPKVTTDDSSSDDSTDSSATVTQSSTEFVYIFKKVDQSKVIQK